jgi:hypothetical protein
MDFIALQESIYFILGILAAVTGAYTTMKTQGKVIYPIQKIESGKTRIKALIEQNEAAGQVIEILDNISPEELAKILGEAGSRYKDGSFSALDAQEIGAMVFDAIREK